MVEGSKIVDRVWRVTDLCKLCLVGEREEYNREQSGTCVDVGFITAGETVRLKRYTAGSGAAKGGNGKGFV
jgi:hypothetical protein